MKMQEKIKEIENAQFNQQLKTAQELMTFYFGLQTQLNTLANKVKLMDRQSQEREAQFIQGGSVTDGGSLKGMS